MPLSYKIVLGSIALLCLVVIGFKAVSSGDEDQPQPITASQPIPATPSSQHVTDVDAANETDLAASSSETSSTASIHDSQSEAADSSENHTTVPAHAQDQNLADVTRELAATASSSDENVTQASPVNESSSTTQVADTNDSLDASEDGEDKGLDDLLARIRQYEADVLGDEPKTEDSANQVDTFTTNDTNASTVGTNNTHAAIETVPDTKTDTTSTDLTTSASVSDTVNSSTEPSIADRSTDVTAESSTGHATENTDINSEIVIPDNPPVVTIGRGAPIQSLAKSDANSGKAKIGDTEAGDVSNASTPSDAGDTTHSTNQSNEEKIAAAVFDPPAVVESKSAESSSAANDVPPTPVVVPIVEPEAGPAATNVTSGVAVQQPGTYTIKPGDTFSSIAVSVFGAERHWLAIADANPNIDSRRMRVGQVIKLPDLTAAKTDAAASNSKADRSTELPTTVATPSKDSHVVRAGETLWAIAKEHYGKGELWHHIYKSNRDVIGSKPGNVRAGMKLRIAALPANR